MRVLAALSGGVDSSVAAARMVAEGHEVIGVTMKLWEGPNGEAPTAGCCTVSDAEDARRVAGVLGIPYYVLDYTDEFADGVVDRFVTDYAAGRTPNPCIECNRTVKFDRLLGHADELGCDLLVTGHYARVEERDGSWHLLRGVDRTKDQSYVLTMLGQAELARIRFPVGAMTKTETRAEAAKIGLRTADKPDSQDICFVGQGDYRDLVRRLAPSAAEPGEVVDLDGSVVGSHGGVMDFTVGQRRGLGVAVGEARYVVELRPDRREVVLGRRDDLAASGALVEAVSWVSGQPPVSEGGLSAKIRYRAQPAPISTLRGSGDHWEVQFVEPEAAVAPGQTLAIYRGEDVLGGGIIRRAVGQASSSSSSASSSASSAAS